MHKGESYPGEHDAIIDPEVWGRGLAREMVANATEQNRMTRATPNPKTVTLHVPFRLVKHGGRKEMQRPSGSEQPRKTDNTLVKALARAFRWKRMLETGEFFTVAELAEREGIAPSYLTRVLCLTLLAPDNVEAILDGRQGPEVTLVRLRVALPASWHEQRDLSHRST